MKVQVVPLSRSGFWTIDTSVLSLVSNQWGKTSFSKTGPREASFDRGCSIVHRPP